jgi:hypothetical protein
MEWGRNLNPTHGVRRDGQFATIRAELFRQRRLLLWVTFLLVVYYCAGVELGTEAESQGLKLKMRNPDFLVFAAWVTWAWAYWRYWQYERTHSDGEYLQWDEQQQLVAAIEMARRKAHRNADAGEVPEIPTGGQFNVSCNRDIQTELTVNGGLRVSNLWVNYYNADKQEIVGQTVSVTLTRAEFEYAKREGRRAFLVGRPYAVDYKAPYWIALLAPLSVFWRQLF